MIKQAVILAAGRGRRMASKLPKPLMDLKGKPIIEHKIEELVQNGVKVCLVINPDFEDVFRKKLKKYDIDYCYQKEPLGTANALYCSKGFVKDKLFLVMMGDDSVELDMKDILNSNRPAVLGFEVDDLSNYGALVINEKGEVEDIIEKQISGRGLVNVAVYVMPKAFFKYYKEIGKNIKDEIGLDSVPKVLSKHGIAFGFKKIKKWVGINTPEDLHRAHKH